MNLYVDCPFATISSLLSEQLKDCENVIVDFHAEASSEKYAMARFLDGKVSLLFGTHTHVPTADEQILPAGSAFISDVGMCGVANSVIGMDNEVALKRFITGRPHGYRLAEGGEVWLQGVVVETLAGKATSIERFKKVV